MAIPTWCTQEVTRIRPATTTSRGSTVFDWEHPDELVITNCSVQPSSTGLSQDGRVLGISEGFTVYLPPDADVRAGDRIGFDGDVFVISGKPKIWQSATGRVSHMQLQIERWSG